MGYRMLGSLSEADDAVQECWLRLHRADTHAVRDLERWLTTVVGHICLDMLRSRRSRREEPLDAQLPEPIVSRDGTDPEHEVLLADAIGLALLVVLDRLAPAERLAFVLHDMFDVPFSEIGAILDRSSAAARQLASRARRRVQGAPSPDTDLDRQRQVVEAFLTAARGGNFHALVGLLAPDIILRADVPGASMTFQGAEVVAQQAAAFSFRAQLAQPAIINGTAGLAVATPGHPIALLAFTITGGRIAEVNIVADPARLSRVNPSVFDQPPNTAKIGIEVHPGWPKGRA